MPTKNSNWNDWSLKVLEELVTLNGKVQSLENKYNDLVKTIDDRMEKLEEKIQETNDLLTGNGTPEKGIIVRTDRLEQNEVRRTWLMRTTIASCIGTIITTIFHWIK